MATAADQMEEIRQQRANRFNDARARPAAEPAAEPAPEPTAQPADLPVTIAVGLTVRNKNNQREGTVAALIESKPGHFIFRQAFNGVEGERQISHFVTVDDKRLCGVNGDVESGIAAPKAKGKAKAKAKQPEGRPKARPKARPQAADAGSDDENTPINPDRLLTKSVAKEIRMGFVRKVYAVLSFQLMLTASIAGPITIQSQAWLQEHMWMAMLAFVGSIVCMAILCCCRDCARRNPWTFLIFFSSIKGVLLGFMSAQYTWQSVSLALLATSLIFLCMTILAWTCSIDFTGYAIYFHFAMMVFVVFGLMLFVMRFFFGIYVPWLTAIFDVFGVLLFTAKILFDTQRILGEWGGHQLQFSVDDWAFASIALYRDILQIFHHLLRLFGKRRF